MNLIYSTAVSSVCFSVLVITLKSVKICCAAMCLMCLCGGKLEKTETDHNVSSVWDGGVDSPESCLICHEVDVRGSSPAVGEGVVVSCTA